MSAHDERIEAIEARVAWLEKSLTELDAVVRGLGDELRTMRAELERVRQTQEAASDELSSGQKWEVPPHY